MLNLDIVFCAMPPGLHETIIVQPKFVVRPDADHPQRWHGFKIAIPIKLWREHFLPHIQALLDGPVLLFGQKMRAYGWSAMIMPSVPIRSTDNAVWVEFEDPEYYDAWLARHNLAGMSNNLTCAPGVRELLNAVSA